MIYDLDYWLHINTAMDIINCPDNRKEYQHLVSKFRALKVPAENIPAKVLVELKSEADKCFLKRSTTWHLTKLFFKKWLP